MRSAIDAAGRVVIPKAVRDAAGLTPGAPIDISFVDGRIEIEVAPVEAEVRPTGRFPTIVAHGSVPPLTDDVVRATLEGTRR